MARSVAAEKRNAKAIHVLGALQITFALVLFVLNMISLGLLSLYSIIATAGFAGIWYGIAQVVCGSMAVHGGKALGRGEGARCPLIASLVLSILSGLGTFGIIVFQGIYIAALSDDNVNFSGYSHYLGHSSSYGYSHSNWYYRSYVVYVLNSMLITHLAVYLAQCLICWGQVVAISVLLCKSASPGTTVVYASHPQFPAQTVYIHGQPANSTQKLYPAPYPAGAHQPYPAQGLPAYASVEKV